LKNRGTAERLIRQVAFNKAKNRAQNVFELMTLIVSSATMIKSAYCFFMETRDQSERESRENF